MLQSSGKYGSPTLARWAPQGLSCSTCHWCQDTPTPHPKDDFQRENYALFFIHSQVTPDRVNVPTMKADCTQHVLQLPPSLAPCPHVNKIPPTTSCDTAAIRPLSSSEVQRGRRQVHAQVSSRLHRKLHSWLWARFCCARHNATNSEQGTLLTIILDFSGGEKLAVVWRSVGKS